MTLKKYKLLWAIVLFMLAYTACKEEEEKYSLTDGFPSFMTETDSIDRDPVFADSIMVLGKKLINPYFVSNMRKALAELNEEWGMTLKETDITTTHLYVRFLPQDSTEMACLDSLGLELFDYPLDYEILEEGEYYKDPTLPEDSPYTWLYTTVSPDFSFPAIRHEVLEECFIPEDDGTEDEEDEEDDDETESDSLSVQSLCTRASCIEDVSALLENKALADAGLIEEEEVTTRGFFSRKRPVGDFTVYDTYLGKQIGIRGVKVRCHIVVKWSTTFTDENGHYRMDSRFRIGPHYALVFKNSQGFNIWGNWGPLAAANINLGWHSKRGYSHNVSHARRKSNWPSHRKWMYCTVNNAGYDYYQMCKDNRNCFTSF